MQPLSLWLQTVGLAHLEPVLVANDIAEDVLTSLTEQDLEKLGLSMGDRKRMLKAIDALAQAEAPVQAAPVAAPPAPRPNMGELRQLTIMFCDLVNSTALCERLSPEQWREVVLAYQQTAAAVIERYGGAIAQYLGDGLLVYFGHPQAHEDAPERAVRTGVALVECIRQLHLEPVHAQGMHLSVRIGIHTGQVVIGDIGAGARRELLALGDTPNLAARLQGLAAPDTVVVSDGTRLLAGGSFAYADLGRHELKGVREPRQVWRVDAVLQTASRFEAATGAGLTPLVGRASELALLTDRWQMACQGRGQTVLLSGEPGIGKSRMLKELCDRLGNAGLNAVRVQCSPHHVHSAFHPTIDSIERALRLTREQPVALKLDRLDAFAMGEYGLARSQVAVLASMLSMPSEQRYGPIVDSAYERERETIAALVDLARARARQSPTLMIYEDAHWADPASVSMLHELIDRTTDVPFLLVIAHRPEFELPAALKARGHVTSLRVRSLQRDEVAALVTRLAGDSPLPDDLAQHIVSKTDGVPLFVEELTRWILESPVSADGRRKEVPTTLRDSLMARLDRHAQAKEIAQIGAVIGREFSRDLVEALAGLPRRALEAALTELTQSGLASEQVGHQGTVYTFKHALVQDAAYDSLLTSRREALHGSIVSVMEDRFPAIAKAEPELLARHASAARQPRVAIPYWRRASELAVQRLALQEAASHLDAGLKACAALPASPERNQIELQLQASLGTAHMLGRGWAAEEVSHAFARANELASAADQVEEAIWPLWGVCIYHLVHGEINRAVAIGQRMMTVARQSSSRNAWLVANMIQVQLCMYSGRFDQVQGHVEQVEHRYCDPQDRALIALYSTDLKLVSMVHGSQTRLFMGLEEEADALCAEQERFAATLNHPYSTAWTLTWGAMSYLHRGRVDELLTRVEEGLRLAEKHGFAYVAGMAMIGKGWALAHKGLQDEGITLMKRGLTAFRATGAGIAVPFFMVLLAEALGRAGQRTEGLSWIAQAEQLVADGGECWHEAELHRIKGCLLAMGPQGDLAVAEASIRHALALATAQQAHAWRRRALRDLAALLQAQQRHDEAQALITA